VCVTAQQMATFTKLGATSAFPSMPAIIFARWNSAVVARRLDPEVSSTKTFTVVRPGSFARARSTMERR